MKQRFNPSDSFTIKFNAMTPPNLIAAMFNVDKVKEQIANCPANEIVILCAHWSINRPKYAEDHAEQEDWDFTEFEQQLDTTLLVNDYDDLVADPHGIYSSLTN